MSHPNRDERLYELLARLAECSGASHEVLFERQLLAEELAGLLLREAKHFVGSADVRVELERVFSETTDDFDSIFWPGRSAHEDVVEDVIANLQNAEDEDEQAAVYRLNIFMVRQLARRQRTFESETSHEEGSNPPFWLQ